MNKNYKRTIFSWSMYDFANQPFTTLVVTFIFISLQLLMPKVDNQKIKNVHLTDNGTPAITNSSINHGIDQDQDMVHALDDSTKTDSTIRLKKDFSKKIQFVNDYKIIKFSNRFQSPSKLANFHDEDFLLWLQMITYNYLLRH